MLVLPEVGLQGYADFAFAPGGKEAAEQKQYYHREAETIPGPATERIADAARRHGMFIQFGLAETALHGNVIYNSTALIGPDGIASVYRKVHNQFEFPYFGPGEDLPVVRTPHAAVGSIICYDLCFPEIVRSYALRGAEVVLMSNAWPMKGHDRPSDYHGWAMDLAAQANAFFNQCWLVISNHCETGAYSQKLDYYGGLADRRSLWQGGRLRGRRGVRADPHGRPARGAAAVPHGRLLRAQPASGPAA